MEDFHFAVNNVAPTLIRVSADEVTYNLHILIRFELEQALISGDLKPADLPAAWNEAYAMISVSCRPTTAKGCLQDGHWACGMFGYFPTYTMGNLFAAQLMARDSRRTWRPGGDFAHGEFGGLLEWLRQRLHTQGSRLPASSLVEQITGTKPDPRVLVESLRKRYGELYAV